MTRDALIKLLRDEHAMEYDRDAAMYWCDCGKLFGHYADWAEHVADLILLGFAS